MVDFGTEMCFAIYTQVRSAEHIMMHPNPKVCHVWQEGRNWELSFHLATYLNVIRCYQNFIWIGIQVIPKYYGVGPRGCAGLPLLPSLWLFWCWKQKTYKVIIGWNSSNRISSINWRNTFNLGLSYRTEPDGTEHTIMYWFNTGIWYRGGVLTRGMLNWPRTDTIIGWHWYETQYWDNKPCLRPLE